MKHCFQPFSQRANLKGPKKVIAAAKLREGKIQKLDNIGLLLDAWHDDPWRLVREFSAKRSSRLAREQSTRSDRLACKTSPILKIPDHANQNTADSRNHPQVKHAVSAARSIDRGVAGW